MQCVLTLTFTTHHLLSHLALIPCNVHLNPADANTNFKLAKYWIAKTFTWLYIGSQDIWALVVIAIYFSKYGAIKLGKDFCTT